MAYSIQVRKLALRMVSEHGIVRTSLFTKISRASLWRWIKFGIDPKKRIYESKLFNDVKDVLQKYLIHSKCTYAKRILIFLKEEYNILVSTKTILRFIKKIGFSRKRVRTRGICKGSLDLLKSNFCSMYSKALIDGKYVIAIDESGFTEKIVPKYGYSKRGDQCILKIQGSWVHYSLLMAISSFGEKSYYIKKGQ
jgi:hypothetical protein